MGTSGPMPDVARYLQLLHELAATTYASLEELFQSHLTAGRKIFGLPDAALIQAEGAGIAVRAVCGEGLTCPYVRAVCETLETGQTKEFRSGSVQCLATPILVDGNLFGALLFASTAGGRSLPPYAREILELLGKGLGGAIYQRQLTEALAYQARHDALTSLPNRVLLSERLAAALESARTAGTTVAVVFIDLDLFKQINDTLGHAAGDAVLKQVAARLAACIEEGDTLARMGGDEFTAILTGVSGAADAVAYARRLLAAVRAPCHAGEYELFVTASIGVSLFPSDGSDPDTLLRNADAAMYSAKYRGKNDIHIYHAEVTASALERLEIETNLRRALERHELRMLYQPQVDLNRKLAAMEVLLAWDHPERGRIPPAQFIPIAEETGMILAIGSWVLRSACRVAAQWHRNYGLALPVSVNVSALQFAQANFIDMVAEVLGSTGLDPRCLELEITESVVMRDAAQSTAILRELRELGVRIAIDDFGTGYSSLSYLRRLPADILKIDQSFLRDLENEAQAFAMLNAIAVLAHTFGLQVVAEGVEEVRQLELARQTRCDRVQGHLFGGALTAGQMQERLSRAARGENTV